MFLQPQECDFARSEPSETVLVSRTDDTARSHRALRDGVANFVREWTASQATGWNAERASALIEDVERFAQSADQLQQPAVAAPAIELAVYLAAFVDGGPAPTGAQRAAIEKLIDRLRAAALGDAPSAATDAAKVSGQRRRVVFYVRPAEREIAGFAALLGRTRTIVRPFDDIGHAVAALADALPDVLVVDDALLGDLHALVLRVERARGDSGVRTPCLVVGPEADADRRLFAQRSGADAVLESVDPAEIVTRIEEIVAQQRAQNFRVLIVEDDRQQAMFCQSVLEHRGMTTRLCQHPNEVVDAIDAFKPDLVLLDLYLPEINGIEVAQRIRERAESALLPIVFLSGEHDLDKRFDAIRMGGDDFVTKPVKPRHLIALVESRIRRARILASGRGQRGERRGVLIGRAAFVAEIERRTAGAAAAPFLVALIAVDGESAVRERAGFVGSGALAQQLAAGLAAEPDLHSICSAGEFAFLAFAHGDDESALCDRLENAREKCAARPWGPSDDPQRLDFTLVGVRPNPGDGAEATIRRAREQLARAQAEGGARAVWDFGDTVEDADPKRRMVRTLLRGQLLQDAVRLRFLPLIPLRGELTGQYVARYSLAPPKSRQGLEIDAATVVTIARELGIVPAVQRHCIRQALRTLALNSGEGQGLRFFLPVEPETVFESAFAPWLQAELRARNIPAASLALQLDASALEHDAKRLVPALRALQMTGVRLALGAVDDQPERARIARLAEFDTIGIARPTDTIDGWTARARLVGELKQHGKLVVASGTHDAHDIGAMLKLGIHYVQSEQLAGWTAEPAFDFASAQL